MQGIFSLSFCPEEATGGTRKTRNHMARLPTAKNNVNRQEQIGNWIPRPAVAHRALCVCMCLCAIPDYAWSSKHLQDYCLLLLRLLTTTTTYLLLPLLLDLVLKPHPHHHYPPLSPLLSPPLPPPPPSSSSSSSLESFNQSSQSVQLSRLCIFMLDKPATCPVIIITLC